MLCWVTSRLATGKRIEWDGPNMHAATGREGEPLMSLNTAPVGRCMELLQFEFCNLQYAMIPDNTLALPTTSPERHPDDRALHHTIDLITHSNTTHLRQRCKHTNYK